MVSGGLAAVLVLLLRPLPLMWLLVALLGHARAVSDQHHAAGALCSGGTSDYPPGS